MVNSQQARPLLFVVRWRPRRDLEGNTLTVIFAQDTRKDPREMRRREDDPADSRGARDREHAEGEDGKKDGKARSRSRSRSRSRTPPARRRDDDEDDRYASRALAFSALTLTNTLLSCRCPRALHKHDTDRDEGDDAAPAKMDEGDEKVEKAAAAPADDKADDAGDDKAEEAAEE